MLSPVSIELVDTAAALKNPPVNRNALARPQDDDIADNHVRYPHLDLGLTAEQARRVGPEAHQSADGGGRLALGPPFQPLAEQDEGDDQRGAFEIEGGFMPGIGCQKRVDAQPPCGRGAECDQQVHIACQCPRRLPARQVKAPAKPELHRGREEELPPAGQHPRSPQHMSDHSGQEWRGQQGGEADMEQIPAATPGGSIRLGPRRAILCSGARLIARVGHGRGQLLGSHGPTQCGDMGAFEREVHLGADHTRHALQGALNPADAGGAGHAADSQVECGFGNLIAGLAHCRGQGCRVQFAAQGHAGLLGREIDRNPRHAGDAAKRLFHPANAGGAGHALDAKADLAATVGLRSPLTPDHDRIHRPGSRSDRQPRWGFPSWEGQSGRREESRMSAMPGGRALDLPMREAPTMRSQLLFRENTMLILNVSGMTCGHCVSAIIKAVKGLPAVEDVQVDRDLGEVRVFGQAEEAAVRAAIVEEGYGVQAAA